MTITEHAEQQTHRLLIFAKAPKLGEVKTRLQPALSIQQSLLLHRRLVEHTIQTAVKLNKVCIELWVGDDHPWWGELALNYGLIVHKQQGKDLGARMAFALNSALSSAERAVIIGCDCPFIIEKYLSSAFDQLDGESIVVGPADDGGYVLLGLNTFQPILFKDIAWGTDQVLHQTLQRAAENGVEVVQLPILRDIDRPEDVVYLTEKLPGLTDGI
jgi:rSAM/selenodomain-associated transferase 1